MDPDRFGGGSTNLYSFTGNDPTNVTDPSGLAWIPVDLLKHLVKDTVNGPAILADWRLLSKDKWRFQFQNDILPSTVGLTSDKTVNVQVTDARMIAEWRKGVDVQWEAGKWAVDFTNKAIWIQATSEKEAADILGPLVKLLNTPPAAANDGIDLYSGKPTIEAIREDRKKGFALEEGTGLKLDKISIRARRGFLTVWKKGNNATVQMIKNLVGSGFGATPPGALEVIELYIELFKANSENDKVNELEKLETEIK